MCSVKPLARAERHSCMRGHNSMNNAAVLVLAALIGPVAMGQSAPGLHRRGETPPNVQTQTEKGYSTLPEGASGEYELDEKGSVVQITIERNRLSGYITKMDHGTALTFFFSRAAVHGKRISFTTMTVHGIHYSFQGEIVRGKAISPALTGYYRLRGDLKTVRGSAEESVALNLKSTPREAAESQ